MILKAVKLMMIPVLAILLLIPVHVSALGLGVSPSKLNFSVNPGGTAKEALQVVNNSDKESQFHIYVDGEYGEWVSIDPSQFTLAPFESRDVELAAMPSHSASGKHDFFVRIVSMLPDSGLRVGAGIKVPAQINVVGFSIFLIILLVEVMLIILLSGILVRRKLQRRRY